MAAAVRGVAAQCGLCADNITVMTVEMCVIYAEC